MRFVIVPNEVYEAIYKKIDAALEKAPQFKHCREQIYQDLLKHFDKYGEIPDFEIEPNKEAN
jgi:hypothetical protein